MKLPRFPIRKSLIPYDDLGIQEVSGDNQVLGDDIGMTLAPAIGLGPTGARVLQADANGRLLAGGGVSGVNSHNVKGIVLLPDATYTDVFHNWTLDTREWYDVLLNVGFFAIDANVPTMDISLIGTVNDIGGIGYGFNIPVTIHQETNYHFGPSTSFGILSDKLVIQLALGNIGTGAELWVNIIAR